MNRFAILFGAAIALTAMASPSYSGSPPTNLADAMRGIVANQSSDCAMHEISLKGERISIRQVNNTDKEADYSAEIGSACNLRVLIWLSAYLFDKDGNDMGNEDFRTDLRPYEHRPLKTTIEWMDSSVTRVEMKITKIELYPTR